ncbi:SDR family oxidoreductase [Nocardia jiangsuensis]|uniref:SDR family oxidoreductase n=1 Tax=Nocardia jiangsuensis TaxID=1691563 RepID=A0ABV8DTS3_9NOCA
MIRPRHRRGARGIGQATAQSLAARGARVWISDIDYAAAQAIAAEIGGHAAPLDVIEPESFRESPVVQPIPGRSRS